MTLPQNLHKKYTILTKRLQRLTKHRHFGKLYGGAGLAVLLLSTVVWSYLGAKLQGGNADQLVDGYLFETPHTLQQAQFPGDHSFLIKWPVFWLIKLFHYSDAAFIGATIGLAVLTVALLAYCLYRLDRRPLVFGTLCLALASILLLVPTQPYGGALLPVNMAMTTTRNLEYALFIGSLVLLARSAKLRSWLFWTGLVGLTVLIASDKLFLTLSAGGALLALLAYALTSRWELVSMATRWFVGSLLAAVGGVVLIAAVNATKLTHIVATNGAGSYGLVKDFHDMVLGGVYGVLGVFTNFGANPAYSAVEVRQLPHAAAHNLAGVAAVAYVVNALLLITFLYFSFRLVKTSFGRTKAVSRADLPATRLAIMLCASAIAALGAFVISDHYYAVDARYLTIVMFALVVTAAVYAKRHARLPAANILLAAGILLVAIVCGVAGALNTYYAQRSAQSDLAARNTLVAEVLKHHKVDTVVGDYWRVLPIKQQATGSQTVTPLSGCTEVRQVLTSKAWDVNLHKHSFAYLLSLEHGPADFPDCTFGDVIAAYGRPNESTLIAGSLSHPRELLLFYDKGINTSRSTVTTMVPATVLPINLEDLTGTNCTGPTIMNIVAHQDDDLLFMDPDLAHSIDAGDCVRTVYVTAGDAGSNQLYWLGREQGSKAAYDSLLHSNQVWIQRVVKLPSGQFVEVASPKGNSKITLIFMHLPDGNLHGNGFNSSHYESLSKLAGGQVRSLQTVDGQSSYTSTQLTDGLAALMHTYQPAIIRTQATDMAGSVPDHSDHTTVGRLTTQARTIYQAQQFQDLVSIPIAYYIGYPIQTMPVNVGGSDLAVKQAAVMAFATHDPAVCMPRSGATCALAHVYDLYLQRQYTQF